MWALHRASTSLRKQAISKVTFRTSCAKSEMTSFFYKDKSGFNEPPQANKTPSSKRFYSSTRNIPKSFTGIHSFSSQAGTKNSGEEDDDLEDLFSELETTTTVNADVTKGTILEDESDHEQLAEEEDDDDAVEEHQSELELLDVEADVGQKISKQGRFSSALFEAIINTSGPSIHGALDKWVEQGNELTRSEITTATLALRRRKMFGRAMQLSEWLESSKKVEFTEREFASRLDLIAKLRGIQKAESYIQKIPESFRGELIYRTLLANCVRANDLKKSEQVFNKMKDLKFSITAFACNQLLLLYKRRDKKKIADVLLFMENKNVRPTSFTYQLLIDTKGQSNDITGMEQIVETMKTEEIELDTRNQATLARHYINAGFKEKAEALLKEMEGSDLNANPRVRRSLLPLYADLGSADEVMRIWKACEPDPRIDECVSAIEAWGKLQNVEEAEAVFDKMSNKCKKLSVKQYNAMLKVYASQKMLSKGKDLVKRMGESGCSIAPLTLHTLVKLFVDAGEVEKADSVMQKAAQQSRATPWFVTYMLIMDQYAKRGDVHKTEKIFRRMRQVGYSSRLTPFHSLLQAYINAKAPPYGFWERMKADNLFPNKALASKLSQADPFKKTAVSDLLE